MNNARSIMSRIFDLRLDLLESAPEDPVEAYYFWQIVAATLHLLAAEIERIEKGPAE